MATTLVIKDGNFATNALDTVELENTVPCTGISLDKQTAEIMSIGGTTTLTATLTPIDTTDAVTWESSDSDVATVNNGVVTTTGVGTATITATCGNYSASCVVTSRAFMDSNVYKRVEYRVGGNEIIAGGNGLPTFNSSLERAGGFASSTGTLHFYSPDNAYPYVLPKGTVQIKFTFASNTRIDTINRILWMNHETPPTGYSDVAVLVKLQSSITITDGVGIADVPSEEGFPVIDSFAVSFLIPTGNTMTENDLDSVTIEFLPAAST